MPKEEHPFSALVAYLPQGSFDAVMHYITQYKVQLTVTQNRKTLLGDYRHATAHKGHRISVNGNLNCYSFLITLLHELAHLFTFERYANTVLAHGKEWKYEFGNILSEFIQLKIFPDEIEKTLLSTLQNPAASSCADTRLMRVLSKYDIKKVNHFLVEQLPDNALFATGDRRIFKKGPRIRTRYKCYEPASKKYYLFSAVYEVKLVED
ncbi:MAG TPA: hypothetical protein PKC62_04445 [Ferruginibacter sp.]|nr:hypothetical protein [Bacteroidota bacterium]MCC6693739.1 hypothetical protein [Chitinophagaceae bacterium]HMT95917.1 hypothetical protein [Ferruginibacter sp.]MBS1925797.1 hypothetical protein [Bacteroidota bacterium]HMU24070.1 hypothetical protein [Ferruginibacter sp.]